MSGYLQYRFGRRGAALGNTPSGVTEVIQRLEGLRSTAGQPPGPQSYSLLPRTPTQAEMDRERLRGFFHVDHSAPSASAAIDVILGRYRGASGMMDASSTRLVRLAPDRWRQAIAACVGESCALER